MNQLQLQLAQAEAARAQQYTELFKNALVYTVVMTNVRLLMAGHEGSVSLLVLCFIVGSTILFRIETYVSCKQGELASQKPSDVSHFTVSLLVLIQYIVSLASNVAVQFTSQLVAELAGYSLQSVTVWWSLFGAAISILFVFVMQKVAAGATIPCLIKKD